MTDNLNCTRNSKIFPLTDIFISLYLTPFQGIRVYVRVRPISQREIGLGDKQIVSGVDAITVKVEEPDVGFQSFSFDACWLPGKLALWILRL